MVFDYLHIDVINAVPTICRLDSFVRGVTTNHNVESWLAEGGVQVFQQGASSRALCVATHLCYKIYKIFVISQPIFAYYGLK